MQEIIVYRNPGEKMMWDLMLSNGNGWPIICAVVAFILIFLLLHKINFLRIMNTRFNQFKRTQYELFGLSYDYYYLIISGVISILVARWMWI